MDMDLGRAAQEGQSNSGSVMAATWSLSGWIWACVLKVASSLQCCYSRSSTRAARFTTESLSRKEHTCLHV